MKKRELSRLITVALATSLILGNVQVVKATETNSQIVNETIENIELGNGLSENTPDSLYLSDIEYDTTLSSAGWGSIKKDVNVDGRTIKLIVDGKVVEFKKGMAAHATSTLVYDVSKYKKEYSRLVTYAGLDQSKGGAGNGAKFSVYTLVNGTDWTLVDEVGLLKSNQECAYIDINIENANYIKLYAHDNGSNGYDHAVYGDAKLVEKDLMAIWLLM